MNTILNLPYLIDEAVSCDNCKGYGWLDHTSLDRSQWMNDITTILKLGEK